MISLGLERQVPVVGTLTFPHRDSRDFKDQVLLEFARLRVGPLGHTMVDRLQYDVLRRAPRETRLVSNFRRRRFPARCSHGTRLRPRGKQAKQRANVRASELSETERGRDPTGWCCGPPECLAGLRVQVPCGSGGEGRWGIKKQA